MYLLLKMFSICFFYLLCKIMKETKMREKKGPFSTCITPLPSSNEKDEWMLQEETRADLVSYPLDPLRFWRAAPDALNESLDDRLKICFLNVGFTQTYNTDCANITMIAKKTVLADHTRCSVGTLLCCCLALSMPHHSSSRGRP